MAAPKDFDGKFLFKIRKDFGFFPGKEEDDNFEVWFYRKESNDKKLKDFLETLECENIGYDKPSNQLFYRSISGKLYRMDFIEVK